MKVYKLTDENMQTHNNFQWELNKTYVTSGEGELCGPGFLHSYEHPLLAVLHNPLHADFDLDTARLFEADASGTILKDNQLKMGSSSLTLIKEIPIPVLTTEQKIKYAIYCAKEVCQNQEWNIWADKWLSGEDRSIKSAEAARAAVMGSSSWVTGARFTAEAAVTAEESDKRLSWVALEAAFSRNINLIAIAERSQLNMFNVGDKVKCVSVDIEFQRFGNSSGDLSNLTIGNFYTVTNVEVQSWHTKIEIDGVIGQFNSELFEKDSKVVK